MNVFTCYVKFTESFYVPRKTLPKVFTFYVKSAESFYVLRNFFPKFLRST